MKKRVLPIILTILMVVVCWKTASMVYYAAEPSMSSSAEISVEAASEFSVDVKTIVDNSNEDKPKIDKSSEDKSAEKANKEEKASSSDSSASETTSKIDDTENTEDAKNEDLADTGSSKESAAKESSSESKETIIFFDESGNTETLAEVPQTSAPRTVDYGRIIFTGDSRTVDMFYSDRNEIWGESHDGIPVFCRDACQSDYMMNAVNSYGWDNFDTLVTWMGCNDYGNFSPYESFYNSLLANGKQIVVCTVGPTDNNTLANDFDREYYTNERQQAYNSALINWASNNGVKVIDLYSYIAGNGNLYISPEDGIHYHPQPTTEIWNYILSSLR
ncbi:SGNH/GDSL hydrolase family protein [Butyrivibrio sp. VCB2006]|uniref:SGNH/GDSL hydrolase family protein n=1 Tax=Butyrivibrio sp. VCB2006 TaxID=1280679 RepID=UPI000492AFD7|nr:SGNH/GDSL hydrolase family protein [Butyrivibrio sp. VCB2006]